jgi:hypothetical protein
MIQRIRYRVFLREVAYLSITCFGGPQAHIAHFQHRLVDKRKYISEGELIELSHVTAVDVAVSCDHDGGGHHHQSVRLKEYFA